MIRRVLMENFKCFGSQEIQLGGITVLAGLNGAGKSSVMQALLLLRQSGLDVDGNPAALRWQGDLVDVGSFDEVLYDKAEQDTIVLEASFQSPHAIYVQVARTDTGDDPIPNLLGFSGASESSLYRWRMFYLGADRLGPQKTFPFFGQGHQAHTPLGTRGEHVLWYLEKYGSSPAENLDPIEAVLRLHSPSYHYQSQLTGASYTEARGEGFLKLVGDGVRLCGRRTLLKQIGDATKLTALRHAASRPVTQEAQRSRTYSAGVPCSARPVPHVANQRPATSANSTSSALPIPVSSTHVAIPPQRERLRRRLRSPDRSAVDRSRNRLRPAPAGPRTGDPHRTRLTPPGS
ncbi:MAG: AAA family ATPase [Spirochaetaceae bacterium]|nr:AAA family ATPase [Spirochaetaceae bacterium]